MSKPNKNDIFDATDEKPDPRAKHLLSLKGIVAQLLKFMYPKKLGKMSISSIVKTYIDKENPGDPYVKLLSEAQNKPKDNLYINDLVFKIDLPEPIVVDDVEYPEAIVNIESQAQNPENYDLKIRILIYACQNFLRENRYLNLKKTEDMYRDAIPLISIWFNFEPEDKKSGIWKGKFNWEYTPYQGETMYNMDNNHSLITIYIVDIGNDFDPEDKNIFSFLYTLVKEQDKNKVIKLFDDYDIELEGGPDMVLSQIEINSFNRGREVGHDEGRIEGLNEAVNNRINILKQHNPDLTDEEARKIAKKDLGLN